MKTRLKDRPAVLSLFALFFVLLAPIAGRAQFAAQPASALTIPAAQLMQPEELNRQLHRPQALKPLILQVGSRVMFDEAHIAGAEYAGPGSHDEGLQTLRNRVTALPRSAFIVIYCGCCPWNRCPNVGPAYKLLSGMGFVNLKVLYLADNFGANWVDMGYPVEHTQ
ncbi:MAG: rhodanese-like domain-containing protein [Terracidiphilus sp.]